FQIDQNCLYFSFWFFSLNIHLPADNKHTYFLLHLTAFDSANENIGVNEQAFGFYLPPRRDLTCLNHNKLGYSTVSAFAHTACYITRDTQAGAPFDYRHEFHL